MPAPKSEKPDFIKMFELKFAQRVLELAPQGPSEQDRILDEYESEHERKLTSEKEAWQERIKDMKQNAEISAMVQQRIEKQLAKQFNTLLDDLHEKKVPIPLTQAQIDLFSLLVRQDVDVNLVRKKIKNIKWLKDRLIKIFNTSGYLQHTNVSITDPNLILSYIGLENIRLWFGYLCSRHWLPVKSFRLHNPVNSFLSYQTTQALAVRYLAKEASLNADACYLAAFLRNCGSAITLNLTADIIEKNWSAWLKDAKASEDLQLHDAILTTKFPMNILVEIWGKKYKELNYDIFKKVTWQKTHILQWIMEINYSKSFSELSPQARVIEQGGCFAKLRFLRKWGDVDKKEMEQIYEYFELSKEDIKELEYIDYQQLPLK